MRCVIICAGEFGELDFEFLPEDFVICCDQGYEYAIKIGCSIHLIVGDFDSISCPLPKNMEILTFPSEKDDSDSVIAVKEGLKRGYNEFALLYSLGGRLDHTIANLQTLSFIKEQGGVATLYGVENTATIIKNESIAVPYIDNFALSIYAVNQKAVGVSVDGVQYKLENATLTNCFPLGLSNKITGEQANISVNDGSLFIIRSRI